jgi:hypothetical protein
MRAQKAELHFRRPLNRPWTDDKGRRWDVNLTLDFDSRGLRFTALQISPSGSPSIKNPPPSVSTRVLQRLPLKKWIAEWAAAKSNQLQGAAATAPWAAMPVLQAKLAKAGTRSPRAESKGTDRYRTVGEIYMRALRGGQSPTKAVADQLKTSRTQAGTLVHRARKLGLLPKTEQGTMKGW